MSRQIPVAASPPSIPNCRNDEPLTVRVITPLFGGGHSAGEVDLVTPISAKGIRGQLRFWWRATRGASCESVEELARREAAIFGTTEKHSLVSVCVSNLAPNFAEPVQEWYRAFSKGRDRDEWRAKWRADLEPLAYALFPLQIDEKTRRQFRDELAKPTDGVFRRCLRDVTFQLRVTSPKNLEPDVNAALWAWLCFGGLGARTRRGLGSLRCDHPDFSPGATSDVSAWLWQRMAEHGIMASSATRPWPTLTPDGVYCGAPMSAISAWQKGIRCLFDFRQGSVGRNRGGTSKAGRSFWPEPESIRAATGYRLNKGSARHHPPEPNKPAGAFPRAEFGLPIVFHFKDSDERNPQDTNAEPYQTELYPVVDGVRRGRMASPLIVKALAISADRAVPVIVRLNVPELAAAALVRHRNDDSPVANVTKGDLRSSTLAAYPDSPLGPPIKPRSAGGSALEAFLAFAQETANGFRKVAP